MINDALAIAARAVDILASLGSQLSHDDVQVIDGQFAVSEAVLPTDRRPAAERVGTVSSALRSWARATFPGDARYVEGVEDLIDDATAELIDAAAVIDGSPVAAIRLRQAALHVSTTIDKLFERQARRDLRTLAAALE